MAVQHRLDLRIHPTFHWHVEEEIICQYLTGIEGGTIDWGVDKKIVQPSGVVIRRIKRELYQLEGFNPDTILFNNTAIPKDLHEEVLKIVSFANTILNPQNLTGE